MDYIAEYGSLAGADLISGSSDMAGSFTPMRYIGRTSAYFAESIIFVDRPVRHRLSNFDRTCTYCGALHWDEEALAWNSKPTRNADEFGTSIFDYDLQGSVQTSAHEETTRSDLGNVPQAPHSRNTRGPAAVLTSGRNLNFGSCCLQGAVVLPMFDKPPPLLWQLYTDNTEGRRQYLFSNKLNDLANFFAAEARHFREHIRAYNNISFSSLGVKIDCSVWGPKGIHTFRMRGELCHLMGSLLPEPGAPAAFLQIYMFESDSTAEAGRRLEILDSFRPNPSLVNRLQAMLWEHNPICQTLRFAKERLASNPSLAIDLTTIAPLTQPTSLRRQTSSSLNGDTPQLHPNVAVNSITADVRRYNRPTSAEVAVLIEDDSSLDMDTLSTRGRRKRDLILQTRSSGQLQRTSELHSGYGAWRYPLLFPFGEQGWHEHMVRAVPSNSTR
jgi:hypothetical protein